MFDMAGWEREVAALEELFCDAEHFEFAQTIPNVPVTHDDAWWGRLADDESAGMFDQDVVRSST